MTISILLADDHTILRQGLRLLLESEKDFNIVGEAKNGLEVITKVETLQPDIVVLDVGLPELNGLEVTRKICQHHHHTRVVILSMHSKEAYVLEAMKNGASAYVLKGGDASELIQAIRHSVQGIHYMSPPLTERAIEAYLQQTKEQSFDPYETLTDREREIMYLVVEGHSNSDISRRLVISPRTVETHRAKMMRKLGVSSQVELIRYAIDRGINPQQE